MNIDYLIITFMTALVWFVSGLLIGFSLGYNVNKNRKEKKDGNL